VSFGIKPDWIEVPGNWSVVYWIVCSWCQSPLLP